MALVLLGGSVSPFVRKVRVVLTEKALKYEHQQINPFSPPPGYRDLSPLGKIPALKDGDRTLCDSSVICAYLEKRFPTPALFPAEPYDYARTLWFEEFADGGLAPMLGQKIFLPLVVQPFLSGGQEPSAEAEETARKTWDEGARPLFEYVEKELGEREFLVGDAMTVADISVASVLANARHAGFAPERKRFPRLRALIERIWMRPSFKAALDEETPVFGRRAARVVD
jgi:glutathione S-transferase